MSPPFEIKRSAFQLPHKRRRPIAVTWKNATIVYGGFAPEEPRIDELSVLFYHKAGKWTKKNTFGDFPKYSQLSGAQVVNDRMFVFDTVRGEIVVYSLDLFTWTWEALTPSGTLPSGRASILRSWVYDKMIYLFGVGYTRIQDANQFFCYNTFTNTWEWPTSRGDIPPPKFEPPSVVISGGTAFLYGGIGGGTQNDLYTLDMVGMEWRKVHGNLSIGEGPGKIRFHTFTRISKSSALLLGPSTFGNELIGKFGKEVVNNSWLLNLDRAKKLMDPSSIWTNLPNHPSKCCHAAVLQPLSKTLWVIGGHDGNSRYFDCLNKGSYTTEVLKVKFPTLRPLKDLAIEHVAKSFSANDPRLEPGQLPKKFIDEIEAYRSENGNE